MTQQHIGTGARLGITGAFEYRDAEGRVLKRVEVSGSLPLQSLGLTEQQAAEMVAQQGDANGDHDCE